MMFLHLRPLPRTRPATRDANDRGTKHKNPIFRSVQLFLHTNRRIAESPLYEVRARSVLESDQRNKVRKPTRTDTLASWIRYVVVFI